jgi:hypothetical protein
MPSREELLESINTELQVCDRANPLDAAGQFRRILERCALQGHCDWARESIDDQTAFQQIADSLQKNLTAVRQDGWVEDLLHGSGASHAFPTSQPHVTSLACIFRV